MSSVSFVPTNRLLSVSWRRKRRADSDKVDHFCRKIPKSWIGLPSYLMATLVVSSFFGINPLALFLLSLYPIGPFILLFLLMLIRLFLFQLSITLPASITSVFFGTSSLNFHFLQIPWLIVGDFNSILHRSKHKGGSFAYYARKAQFFLDFINGNNLIDLNYSGPHFTWCNNQSGLARRWARLDRCLINLAWASSFQINNLKHLSRSFSDHSPLFLSSSPFHTHSKHVLRFDNNWFDFVGCHNAVRDAWSCVPRGNPMHAFTHLLSHSRFNLRKWHRNGVNKAESNIINIEAEIGHLENSDFNLLYQSLLME